MLDGFWSDLAPLAAKQLQVAAKQLLEAARVLTA
jgi:hypothetical protein